MRLLTVLLLSMVSLFADTSDRLPNTRKTPSPLHAPKRAVPSPARISKAVKGSAAVRGSKRVAPGASIKARGKAIRLPRLK